MTLYMRFPPDKKRIVTSWPRNSALSYGAFFMS